MITKQNVSQFENFTFVVTLLMVFMIAARAPLDNDLWWHLRSGELTWQTLQPTLQDQFSYTRLGQPWINHSWLSQVVLYALFHFGDAFALGTLTALMAVICMGLVYSQCEGAALLKSAVVLFGSMVASVVWSPRPQMFSLLLFSLMGFFLNYYQKHKNAPLWIIPLLFALWSNLHGGYPLGIMLMGVTIIGGTLENVLGPGGKGSMDRQQIIKLGFCCSLSIIFLLINPNGFNTWMIPFKTINVEALRNLISEWASPDFHDPVQQLMLVFWFLLFFGAVFSSRKPNWIEFLTIVIFGGMAFVSRRNFGPFAISASPILSRYLWNIFQLLRDSPFGNVIIGKMQKASERSTSDLFKQSRWKTIINLSFIVLIASTAFCKLYFVTHPPLYQNFLAKLYPVKAVNWLKLNNLQGNMLNEYDWGGYLIWNLRDKYVFVDGRTDLFGDEIINQWVDMIQASDNMPMLLDAWKINLILITPDHPASKILPLQGWRTVYRDEIAVIIARNPP